MACHYGGWCHLEHDEPAVALTSCLLHASQQRPQGVTMDLRRNVPNCWSAQRCWHDQCPHITFADVLLEILVPARVGCQKPSLGASMRRSTRTGRGAVQVGHERDRRAGEVQRGG